MSNLYLIIDNNHSTDRSLSLGNIGKKFDAFGWETIEIDGHDHVDIHNAFTETNKDIPKVIIANTIKGYGIQEMENNPAWHHRCPTTEEMERFLEELK